MGRARTPSRRGRGAWTPARVRSEDYARLRLAVAEREGWRCAWAGCDLTHGFEAHHRRLRSQGGRDNLQTLIALCSEHHRWVHDHPEEARARGFIVRARSDPALVAVVLWTGRTVRLDADGGYDVCWDAAA